VSGSNLATFQYASTYFHAASGLELAVYRAYDPSTGRWLSRDPIKENGGANLYDYVHNQPSWLEDSLGLCSEVPGSQKFLKGTGKGEGWHLTSFSIQDTYKENLITIVQGVGGTWTAQVYVLCDCCGKLFGTSGTKTFSMDHVAPSQIIAFPDATAVPVDMGSPFQIKDVFEGVGEMAGQGAGDSLGIGKRNLSGQDANIIINTLQAVGPTLPSQGEWVGGKSPCDKLK